MLRSIFDLPSMIITKSSLNDMLRHSREKYKSNKPFPHIIYDTFLPGDLAEKIYCEFPDLSKENKRVTFRDHLQNKLASQGNDLFVGRDASLSFINFMNSSFFLEFLNELTEITEQLIPDVYLNGGGFHQTIKGGFLKLHTDFAFHPATNLDRRINAILYLNKEWKEEYGGDLELWSHDMSASIKIKPIFNRLVIFETNDYTLHGHPDPLRCPEHISRNSIALYYYSNGRPACERNQNIDNSNTNFFLKSKIERLFNPVKEVYYRLIKRIP